MGPLTASLALLALAACPASSSPPKPAPPAAGIEWVEIPGGTFLMGDSDTGADSRPHRVTVPPFFMARTEVTREQYAKCVAAGRCRRPACDWPPAPGELDLPAVCVDFGDAEKFSAWAGGRLPSEAEWEYAARSAGRPWRYPWGNAPPDCGRAAMLGCAERARPVCSYPPGRTAQGLCDMAGNVWEWVRDWYHGSYAGAPADGSALESPPGQYRVNRGGSWGSPAGLLRTAYRRVPGLQGGDLGFRPVRER